MRIGVVGGGVMGLAAAHELAKAGHSVVLFEKQEALGGMAASFAWNGICLERYYHFICLPDRAYRTFLEELGLEGRLRWRPTRMAYFYRGRLHGWGSPWSLLRFPGVGLVPKVRYGLNVFYSKFSGEGRRIENIPATKWLTDWMGKAAYEVFWKSLLEFKFGAYADELSAAWIRSRIKRVANSRKRLFREYYGYLEGGTSVFIDALAENIRRRGGTIELACPVEKIDIRRGTVRSVGTPRGDFPVDGLISTIPLPEFLEIPADLPEAYRRQLSRVKNIGILCLLFMLKKPVTGNFWLNINDPRIGIPGLIEYTNLNPAASFGGRSLIYIPQYLPASDPRNSRPDQDIAAEYLSYLRIINPAIAGDDVAGFRVFRSAYAQPIPSLGWREMLSPIESPIKGLYVADTSHYFPEDRTIDQSLSLGRRLAEMIFGKAEKANPS